MCCFSSKSYYPKRTNDMEGSSRVGLTRVKDDMEQDLKMRLRSSVRTQEISKERGKCKYVKEPFALSTP